MNITIGASVSSKIGFASHQNAVPVLRELELENAGEKAFDDLTLTLSADPPFLQLKTWRIDRLSPGAVLHVTDRDIALNASFLGDLDENISGTVTLCLKAADETLANAPYPVELLARNHWGGIGTMAELLPAFVMPNDPAVDRILKAASDVLRRAGRKDGIDGYEAKSRTRVWELTSAIWSAVCGFRISYALPPASFENAGQKIRTPSAILEGQVATCLDTALLFAAALEQAGLNPLVLLTRGHAFTGVWLQPVEFAALVTEEAAAIRRRVDVKDMVVFETTLATQGNPPGLALAEKTAQRHIAEDAPDPFEIAIDVRRARMQRIRPLSTLGGTRTVGSTHDATPVAEALEAAPALPGFDVELAEETDAIHDRVALWQRKLLNLTTSNRLLHVPDGSKVVRLVCPDAGRLEDRLAAGQKVRIVPMPDLAPGGRDEKLYEAQTNKSLREQVATAALDRGEVPSLLPKDKLEAGLIDLYRKARSDIDEGGANTLFLALGFLKWKKKPEDERSYRAPLILLPVKLERKSALSGVVMTHHEDEPRFNLTLLELLRQDFELSIPGLDGGLPTDDSGIDVVQVWNIVRRAVRDIAGFEVVPDVVLGTFSFAKYLMWKDLVDRSDRLKESPIVRHLIEREGVDFDARGEFPQAERLDDSVDPTSLFTPLPADSSQLAAVVASARGHDFVLDGPPGTGKSQTIANMIAHNLALGRRVLFVAEKMAALDVVQRRLAEKGLGEFCLELHSTKATKAEVLKRLDRAWTTRETMSEDEWTREAAEAKRLRDSLNDIVRLLHRCEPNGLTVHRAIGRVVRDGTETTPRLAFAPGVRHDEADLSRLRDAARRLGLAQAEVAGLPKALDVVKTIDWSNGWQENIVAAARRVPSAIDTMQAAHQALMEATRLPLPAVDKDGLGRLRALVGLLLETYGRDARLTFMPDMPSRIAAARDGIGILGRYRTDQSALSGAYAPEAARRIDLAAMGADWQAAGQKFWFLATFAKKKVARALAQAGGVTGEVTPEIDLPRLEEMAQLLTKLDALAPQLVGMPGWAGLATDLAAVEAACAAAERLRAAISAAASDPEHLMALRHAAGTLVVDGNDLLGPDGTISRAAARLAEAAATLDAAVDEFGESALAQSANTYDDWRAAAEAVVANEARLQAWANWQRARHDAVDAGLTPLVTAIEAGIVQPPDAVAAFETGYARWFASQMIDAEPLLRQFTPTVHMDDIAAFRRLDDRLSELSVRYIRAKLCGQIPSKETVGKKDGYAVLKHQLQLKQRHKPIRQLAIEMGDAFTRLAPCMLMSPLSIAQYLPPDQALFDLVIFDEASQITPWDAIGAMARGRQVVIAGDPRQMPPTSFFARSANTTDSDTDTEEDMESILDECLGAGVPMHSLSWHYRSRHESLIAFSNHRYYESGLVTFPAPVTRASAVEWRRVPGLYARGKGRTNQIEAQAMVDEAVRRLTDPAFVAARHTLGIITLNADQQKLVEDLLDKARREHPEIEPHFGDDCTEPVVVKNLETVQGDERDLIMLGIGFGPTEPTATTMSMSFGALNAQGGWRRLNVAVTRARQEMMVFTSFDPGMIDLHRTSARAVADLKHFVEFAHRGPRALAEAVHGSVGGFDSPFEEAVAAELTRRGWTVVPQIGVSRFRIDIGIVHPDRPGDYLVGVECDGAAYHSAATARDRDKVRAAILKGLGWELLRVWSTDWWIDKKGAADRLHRSIESVLAASRAAGQPDEGFPALSEIPSTADQERDVPYLVGEPSPIAVPTDEDEAAPMRMDELVAPALRPSQLASPQASQLPVEGRYRVTDFSSHALLIDPDAFYDDRYDETLASLIAHVLETEAPIAETLLVQRIARAHGFQRAGRIIRDRVMQLVSRRHHAATDGIGEAFIWTDVAAPNGWNSYRVPATPDDMRQIEEIALPELAMAARSSRTEDVPVDIARKFGIRRLSSSARHRIEVALTR
jgi:very-short-patch-repair endonuclease